MTDTGKDRWQRLSALFERALDLDPAAQAVLLDTECADDPALRAELERMLAADALPHAFDQGAAEVAALDPDASIAHDDPPEAIGSVLGHWRLEETIGRGGMGTVYAARRDDRDTQQRAALKRLHRRWDGSLQAQRFLQERRILAALSHPNIPRLFDHGLDNDQRPWFALELVQGQSLVRWADEHQLDLRARLDLFRQVCAAVQHAHEHFVVHRDLKPDNILVDGEGHAKVLDFGVAKRIDDVAGATRTGVFVGFTPEYAAPEQISGGTISAATDVYALGVILYQLLSGNLPYSFDQDDLRATAEAITGRAAARLDQAITTGTHEEVRARLAQRKTDERSFRRFVKGDLSRIVQTALAKEPPRRYASVQAFSSDIERFLKGRTVSVSGDTFGYRARKYISRNRWGVAMASLAAVALIGGTVFSTYRAEQERLHRERSDKMLEFMSELFVSDTEGAFGNQLSATQLLERAAERIDANFTDDARSRAELLGVVGSAYIGMGLHEQAPAFMQRTLDTFTPFRDSDPEQYLLYAAALVNAIADNGQNEEVVKQVGDILPFARKHGDERMIATLLHSRGGAYRLLGNLEAAEADLRAAIQGFEALGAPETSGVYTDLAGTLSDSGDPQAALDMLRKSEREYGAGRSQINRLIDLQNQARELYRLGRAAEGIPLLEKAVPGLEALGGPAFNRTVVARNGLAQHYAAVGRNADALTMVERNLQLQVDADTISPVDLTVTRMIYAKLLVYSGRFPQALPIAREGTAFMLKEYPEPTNMRGRAQWILGETLLQSGLCAEAIPVLRGALSDELATTGGKPTAFAAEANDSLGRCLLVQGDTKAAVEALQKAEAQSTATLGAEDRRTLRTRIHHQWALHVQAPTPQTLAALIASRTVMVAALGTEETPVIWQLDLLLDGLSGNTDATRLDPQRRRHIQQALAKEAASQQAPRFVGMNSFS